MLNILKARVNVKVKCPQVLSATGVASQRKAERFSQYRNNENNFLLGEFFIYINSESKSNQLGLYLRVPCAAQHQNQKAHHCRHGGR